MRPAAASAPLGVPIALALMSAWAAHLVYLLGFAEVAPASLRMGVHALVQAYLFTGLFITGHDAMHGTVSPRAGVNRAVGTLACFLFAGLSYRRLVQHHRAHHAAPTHASDPDFHPGGFLPWLFAFMRRYTTLLQLGVMALSFNVLLWLCVPQWRVWAFWVAPSLLATLQLFYFGTYRPHRRPQGPDAAGMAPHFARSLMPNHLWAMLSCYFFGYHWEHHESPGTPWWALWQVKESRVEAARGVKPPARPGAPAA
jgi:beta-carotene ketolase (CrtW type)